MLYLQMTRIGNQYTNFYDSSSTIETPEATAQASLSEDEVFTKNPLSNDDMK